MVSQTQKFPNDLEGSYPRVSQSKCLKSHALLNPLRAASLLVLAIFYSTLRKLLANPFGKVSQIVGLIGAVLLAHSLIS